MNYYLYSPYSYKVRAELKKGLREMEIDIPHQPWQRTWIELLNEGLILPDIASPIVFLEHWWFKDPVCLMPESEGLVTQLLNTNFEGQIKALKPFADVFSIALPKQTTFNDQKIQGLFVHYLTPKHKDELVEQFNRDFATQTSLEGTGIGGPQLGICYQDPDGMGRIVLNLDLCKLEWILQAEDIDTYHELTGVESGTVFSYDLSDHERRTQFEILKFVIAFIVYIGAHENSVAFMHDIKLPGSDKGTARASIHRVRRFRSTGSVRPHYRNLRHVRYYQGRWGDWAPGSRWIPVNMHTARVDEM